MGKLRDKSGQMLHRLKEAEHKTSAALRKAAKRPILQEFKEFAVRGNVIDLAIGVMVGAGFNKIVTSLVNDILMPPLGLLFGPVDFSNMYVNLSGKEYPTLAAAKEAGAPTLNYGLFINTVLDFAILAFVVFLLVRQINKLRRHDEPVSPTTKSCPFCVSVIAIGATRCPQCTSMLDGSPAH